jgi:DNA polymerase-4
VAALAAADPAELAASFGPATGPWLVQTACGVAGAEVTDEPYQARGHGREETFQRDITDWDQVGAQVRRLAAQVAADVAAERRPASRIIVKVRYVPFLTYTRGAALPEPTQDPAAIEAAALAALDRFSSRRPVRLLGVRAEFAAEAAAGG